MSAILVTPAVSPFLLFSCSVNNVMIDAGKKAENDDKIILRVHEFTGISKAVMVNNDLPISSWQECNLMEKPIGKRNENTPLIFNIQPYEIKTFIVDVTQG